MTTNKITENQIEEFAVEQLLNLEKSHKLKPTETIHVPVFKLEFAA